MARLLAGNDGFDLVGSCTVHDILACLELSDPDVVLVEYEGTARTFAHEVIAEAKQRGSRAAFLLMAASVKDAEALALFRAGLSGIYMKSGSVQPLLEAIGKVAAGGHWLDDYFSGLLVQSIRPNHAGQPARLSPRERDVLRMIYDGLANKEIAAELAVSESAVKSTVQHLFRKTDTSNRAQLIRAAMKKYPDILRQD